LKVRLETCIDHLKKQLETTEEPVEELRSIINKLSGEMD
jgi:chaperonin cofactor prefoldin